MEGVDVPGVHTGDQKRTDRIAREAMASLHERASPANIFVIFSHQVRTAALGVQGHPVVGTPHIDAAEESQGGMGKIRLSLFAFPPFTPLGSRCSCARGSRK